MPSHAELVTAFGRGLRDGAPPACVTACPPGEVARRFAVHANNVAQGLTRALASRFPVILRLVGEDFFQPLARAFIEAHPPASPVLLAWGGEFAPFLEGFPPVRGLPYLADVARIEMARGRAFHAADRAPLPPEALARAAQHPGRARLGLHPSVQLVRSRWAAVSIWQANQPGAAPRRVEAGRPEIGLVLRDRAFGVPVLAIGPGDAAFLEALAAGAPPLACAKQGSRAEPGHDPTRLLGLLAGAGALIHPDPEDPS